MPGFCDCSAATSRVSLRLTVAVFVASAVVVFPSPSASVVSALLLLFSIEGTSLEDDEEKDMEEENGRRTLAEPPRLP